MTNPTKLDARARLAAAEGAASRWRKSIAKAEAEVSKAAEAGNAEHMCTLLERIDRCRDRLAAAEGRALRLREALPRALSRERAAQVAVRAGVKLATRISTAALARAVVNPEPVQPGRKRKAKAAPDEPQNVERGYKVVPDPWEPGARLSVPCNMRESPIEHMAARKRLNAAQKEAGDRYRALYEFSQLGPLRAMDIDREQLHTGRVGDPVSDQVIDAARELAATNKAVGKVSAAILISIVGEGVTIDTMAQRYTRMSDKRAHGYVTGRLIEALDQLVEWWGLVAEGYSRQKIKGSGPISVTGPQVEHDLVNAPRHVNEITRTAGIKGG
ncbi:DUF6456 domain-containing protein [Xanthobacter sp. V0B-10]|uniref:DUF6456 domain-containing protein n=1 Tax=Xanthobacter albus TaxID=3119929 RepID=UPI003729730E